MHRSLQTRGHLLDDSMTAFNEADQDPWESRKQPGGSVCFDCCIIYRDVAAPPGNELRAFNGGEYGQRASLR